jgi:hypothetical protein
VEFCRFVKVALAARLREVRILALLPVSDGRVAPERACPQVQQREQYGPVVILLRTRKISCLLRPGYGRTPPVAVSRCAPQHGERGISLC